MASFFVFPLILTVSFITNVHSSVITDRWGSISLPFRTNFCQDTLPVDVYTLYECEQDEYDNPIIHKTIYEDSLCTHVHETLKDVPTTEAPLNLSWWYYYFDDDHDRDRDTDTGAIYYDSEDEDEYAIVINESSSIPYDCSYDLDNPDIELHEEIDFVMIQTNCHYDPPAQRGVFLDQNVCFLLSNITMVNRTSQVLYGKFDCEFEEDTTLVTRLYLDDALCTHESIISERRIVHGNCDPWLYPNETGFAFEISAEVWHCWQEISRGYRVGIDVVMVVFVVVIYQLFF